MFSSLAYTFMGPIKSKSGFAAAVKKIQWKTLEFIRANKDAFFSKLNRIYDEDFPGHGLTADMAFEQCCVYLLYLANSPDNHRWQNIFWCASAVFQTPITIMFENSEKTITVGSYASSADKPAEFFKKSEGTFLPVLGNDEVEFSVATWNLKEEKGQFISSQSVDNVLARNNITVACLQSSWDGVYPGFTTRNYHWTKFYFGVGSHGVIMLMNKHSNLESLKFTTYSHQIVSVAFSYCGEVFKIVGCDFSRTENLKDDLTTVAKILQVADSDQVLILGDFSAFISQNNTNQNGEILKMFSLHFNLRIETAYPPASLIESSSHILLRTNSSPPLLGLTVSHFYLKPSISLGQLSACRMGFTPEKVRRHQPSQEMHSIVSWFVESLSTLQKRNQVEQILISTNATFACILFKGNPHLDSLPTHKARYHWLISGNVAFVLKKNSRMTIENFKTISPRIATANVRIYNSEFFIVGCMLSNVQLKQEASSLLSALNKTPPTAKLVVMGEFNADIGFSDLSEPEKALMNSANLNTVRSDPQGQILKRLALLHSLYFVSTLSNRESCLPEHHTNHILVQNAHQLKEIETKFQKFKSFENKMMIFKFPLNAAGF